LTIELDGDWVRLNHGDAVLMVNMTAIEVTPSKLCQYLV